MSYTKGPWRRGKPPYHGNEVFGIDACDGGPQLVAQVYGYSDEEMKANLRLIGAADVTLEALEDMLSGWRYIREVHGDLDGVGWDRAEQAADAAIKQARGR